MALFEGSRYRFSQTLQVEDENGEVERIFVLRKTTVYPPAGSQPYTTVAGDTFEKIASKRYQDANKWYVIADANPHVFWPLDLQPGTLIFLPPRSFAAVE